MSKIIETEITFKTSIFMKQVGFFIDQETHNPKTNQHSPIYSKGTYNT